MITNVLGLPQPFVSAVTNDYKPTKGRYSVTRVLGSPCEAVLLRRHGNEISGDVADYVWQIFGSAVHKILEESKETDEQIKENFITVPIDEKYTISGIFDLYDDKTGTVTDWKTASIWKIKFANFDDWRKQTLYYCWMLRQIGFNASRGQIVAMIKDHSKREASRDKEYPQHPVYQICWDFSESDIARASEEIRDWFKRVEVAESLPDEQLTPCTPEQRWHKDDKWAVMKKGQKRAVRLYESEKEAQNRCNAENRAARERSEIERHYIEFREGEDTKCDGYCDVRAWCPYYQRRMQAKKNC